MVKLYQEAGYREIHDLTSERYGLDAPGNGPFVLKELAILRRRRYRISMRVNADLLHNAKLQKKKHDGEHSKPWQYESHNHYVDLVSPIDMFGPPNNPFVTFFVFTRGDGTRLVPDDGLLSLEDFARHYFGCVCAKY